MRKVLLITGASEQDRDRFIRYRQNTETCELRSILPLCNEYILDLLRKYSSHCINQPRNQICP